MPETMTPADQPPENKVESFATTVHVILRIFEVVLAVVALILADVIVSNNICMDTEIYASPKGTATKSATLKLNMGASDALRVWTGTNGTVQYIQNRKKAQSFKGDTVAVNASDDTDLVYRNGDAPLNVLVGSHGEVWWGVGDSIQLPEEEIEMEFELKRFDKNLSLSTVREHNLISYNYNGEPDMWFYGNLVKVLVNDSVQVYYRKYDQDLQVWIDSAHNVVRWRGGPNVRAIYRLNINSNFNVTVSTDSVGNIQYIVDGGDSKVFAGNEMIVFADDIEVYYIMGNPQVSISSSGQILSTGYTGEVYKNMSLEINNVFKAFTQNGLIIYFKNEDPRSSFTGTEIILRAGNFEFKYRKGNDILRVSYGKNVVWTGCGNCEIKLHLRINVNHIISLWTGPNSVIYYKVTDLEESFSGTEVVVQADGNITLKYKKGGTGMSIWVTSYKDVRWKFNFHNSNAVNVTKTVTVQKSKMLSLSTDIYQMIILRGDKGPMVWFDGSGVRVRAGAVLLEYARGDAEMRVWVDYDGKVKWTGGGKHDVIMQHFILTGSTMVVWTDTNGAIHYNTERGKDIQFNGTGFTVKTSRSVRLHYKKFDPGLEIWVDKYGNVTWTNGSDYNVDVEVDVPYGTDATFWTSSGGLVCYSMNNGTTEVFKGKSATVVADGKVEISYVKNNANLTVRVGSDGAVSWTGGTSPSLMVTSNPEARRREVFTLVLLVFTITEAIVTIIAFSLFSVSGGKAALAILIYDVVLAIIFILLTSLSERDYAKSGSPNSICITSTVLLLAISIVLLLIICTDYFMWHGYDRKYQNGIGKELSGNVLQPNASAVDQNAGPVLQNSQVVPKSD